MGDEVSARGNGRRAPDYAEARRWLDALTRAEWATLAIDLMREASGECDEAIPDDAIADRLETLAIAFGWQRIPAINRSRAPRGKRPRRPDPIFEALGGVASPAEDDSNARNGGNHG
jgi:hypothetical protein